MRSILVVAAGSGLGGAMRYLLQLLVYKLYPSLFPAGTFFINVIGCFLIGIFFALAEKQQVLSADTRLFLITGICGGFTTFSTFSLDNLLLLKSGNFFHFFLYAVGSLVLGLVATYVGITLFKTV